MKRIDESIFISNNNRYERIDKIDILFIEAQGSYVDIYAHDRKISFSTHLKSILDQMKDENFVQVSRKHIVNINHIQEIHNDYLTISNFNIPTSKMYKSDLLEKIPIIKTKQKVLIEKSTVLSEHLVVL
ncbi:LytTR family DNA-binding domain-containing protein [Lacihabitans sp. LS3-19]|uniref:LytR/AlgR family response regulator transcription factor n=1 Tax=Lacihabitans sp. LS3-19 TaxID=2487335 RepID=UPI0020CE7A64|nr:LytTR family DNA-binding domain-containing protein [Lacihabitans sp. LS3-19]